MRFINAIEKFTEWQSLRVKEGTHISYENMLKHFCFFVNNKDVERVTTDDITRWFYLMEDMRYNQNTARSKAIALRRFFEYLKMRDYKVLDFRLIQVPKKTIKQPHAATKEEYEKLMKNFNGNRKIDFRNKALVELYWDTGARNSEILSLNVSDLDLVNRRAIIKTKKALNHVREISWTPDTNESIKNWLEIKNKMKKLADEDALFISILGRKRGQRLTISGVCCIMKTYSEKSGIKTLNAHSFRHHLGRQLAKRGINNSVISGILGHCSLESSYIYTVLENNEYQEILDEARE